jgi:hypothetical protein
VSIFAVELLGQHPYLVPAHPPIDLGGLGPGPGIGSGAGSGPGVGYGGRGLYPGQFVPKKLIFEFTPSGQQPNSVCEHLAKAGTGAGIIVM